MKPPEGGGGSGSAGSPNLVKLAFAHLSLLISTITESNYENKRKEIREVGPCYLSLSQNSGGPSGIF